MIITTNNNTITVGPAWPCCYEYPTQAPNITGNHENVSFEEIKRRFYNSPKSATFTIPNLKVYYDPDTQANAFNPNGQNVTAEQLESWSEALASLLSGETMTLYGNQWFHSDENGTGSYWEFFLINKKKVQVNVLGETIEGVLDAYVVGSVGPATFSGQPAEMLELVINFGTLPTASGKGASISFTLTKFIDKTLSNFVIGDFNGNFGARTTTFTPTYLLNIGPGWPNQYLTRQIVGEGGISSGLNQGVGARLQLDGNCNVTFTPVTTSDWDFDLNGFTIASSGQNQFGSITTPGQDLDQINDLLNAPNLNYTATGTGIFKHDPVNIGIGNYPSWPQTMYYDCRKFVPPTYSNPYPDVGGVFFNSPNLNYYNFGPAFYLKPYLIPIEGIQIHAYQSNTSSDPYVNGLITHPDAPKVIVNDNTIIFNSFYEIAAPGDYYYTGVKMSTPYKYISVYFDFFQYRINRSQAGGAYIGGYMPPFQDW